MEYDETGVLKRPLQAVTVRPAIKLFGVIALLFIFLIGINTLSASFRMMGSGFANTLFNVSSHPVIGLFTGMLATALIQSSSTTTAIIVGLCSSGTLSIGGAVPMIMGSNIGTSVTNTVVSLSYVGERSDFRRAFSAATVHDVFNLLSVALLLPLEIATGIIEKTARAAAGFFYGMGGTSSSSFKSPLKAAIKPVTKGLKGFVTDTLGFDGTFAGIALMLLAAVIIILALATVVKIMKTFVDSNKGEVVEKLLAKNPYVAMLSGVILTIAVQSSSITTSLLVPMAGAGVLSTRSIFPVTIGANIGTTTTALIASLTGNVAGLTIALVHFIFNCLGTLIWFPITALRNIPLNLAEKLGEFGATKRWLALAYVAFIFFGLPLILITIF